MSDQAPSSTFSRVFTQALIEDDPRPSTSYENPPVIMTVSSSVHYSHVLGGGSYGRVLPDYHRDHDQSVAHRE